MQSCSSKNCFKVNQYLRMEYSAFTKYLKAMKRLKISSLTLLALFISIISLADETVSFPKEVNFIKMTAVGIAVVGTDDALYGVDRNGKPVGYNNGFKINEYIMKQEKWNVEQIKERTDFLINKILDILTRN